MQPAGSNRPTRDMRLTGSRSNFFESIPTIHPNPRIDSRFSRNPFTS